MMSSAYYSPTHRLAIYVDVAMLVPHGIATQLLKQLQSKQLQSNSRHQHGYSNINCHVTFSIALV